MIVLTSCYKIYFTTGILNKIANLAIKDIAKGLNIWTRKNKLILRLGIHWQWIKIQKLVDKIEINKKFPEILEPKNTDFSDKKGISTI